MTVVVSVGGGSSSICCGSGSNRSFPCEMRNNSSRSSS